MTTPAQQTAAIPAEQPVHQGVAVGTATRPLHRHDCDACIFLGRHFCVGAYAGAYDLYYHPGHPEITESVIARYGDEGSYYSGMHFAAPYVDITGAHQPGITPLIEAKRRAALQNLMALVGAAA